LQRLAAALDLTVADLIQAQQFSSLTICNGGL